MEVVYFVKVESEHQACMQNVVNETETQIQLALQTRSIPKVIIDSAKAWNGFYYFTTIEKLENFLHPDKEFEADYQLLGRLQHDCAKFIDGNSVDVTKLWAGNIKSQIAKMKELYNRVPIKPVWCSLEDICTYEFDMLIKVHNADT